MASYFITCGGFFMPPILTGFLNVTPYITNIMEISIVYSKLVHWEIKTNGQQYNQPNHNIPKSLFCQI